MDGLRGYFNPLARMGIQYYSVRLPLVVTVWVFVLLELFFLFAQPEASGRSVLIIIASAMLIIYFSFRDGIQGGTIATAITTLYYFYIIYSRNYTGRQLIAGIEATFFFAFLYLFLSLIIGWLKQAIDSLIVKEQDARRVAEDGEIRLQTILEQLPVGVLLAEASERGIEGNRQLEKILGRRVVNQLISDPEYSNVYRYPDNKRLSLQDWPITRALQNGEVITAEEMAYLRPDGNRIYLRVNAAPIRNRKREIIAAVSTIDDVTQEKEIEQRKDNFINMASHELKTPVTSIKLYLELLLSALEKNKDPSSKKIVTSMQDQTKRLQELVEDLLDVTRTQTGKLRLNKEHFRLDKIVRETVRDLTAANGQSLQIKANQPLTVLGDHFRIAQVLTNLITNSMKYSPQDKKIHISSVKKGGRAVVTVRDFGIGIAKEHQKHVFERLYQVDPSPTNAFPGIGMGLFISKEILKRHRGNIWVKSEPGKGAAFSFSLPLVEEKPRRKRGK